jgi:Spy/CpxP family protein refolding chaperone
LLAGLTTAILASSALAQGTIITGKVRSTQGTNLQAANVRIPNLNVSVGSDENGVYRIVLDSNRVRGQTISLSARAVGYKPQNREITLRGGPINIDFSLEFDANRTSEVVVYNLDSVRAGREKQLAFTVQRGDTARNPALQTTNTSFSQHLFPPELIMQHQSRLRITEPQREVILQEITKVQTAATQAQWRVSDEAEKLNELLSREGASEADILAQAERMMNWEEAVKRAQLSMLIRIRNVLTAEQRTMLRELRRRD